MRFFAPTFGYSAQAVIFAGINPISSSIQHEVNAILSISALTFAYTVYHFLIRSEALQARFEQKWGKEQTKIYWIYFQRWLGVVLYGVIPLVLVFIQQIDCQEVGLAFKHPVPTLLWTLGLSALVIPLNYFAAKAPDNQAMYPQIRIQPPWPRALLINSAFTWFAYLLAYEFAFRGFLFFTCEKEMGLPLAISVNVSLYVLVHIAKGWKEAVGAVPLGIVLCLLTYQTGTIWIAFLVHVVMAWANEWWSYYWAVRKRGE